MKLPFNFAMKFPFALTAKDSRGKPSATLFLVRSGYFVLLVKFALADLTFPLVGKFPDMSAWDFAIAAGALLFGWGYREHAEKRAMPLKPPSPGEAGR